MTTKEILKNLKNAYDSEHYPMSEFVSESELDIINRGLERLEELEKAQDIEISNLKFIDEESKYQTSIRMLKEAFIVLGRSDITNTCWFKYLEELEKENQELRDLYNLTTDGNWNLKEENAKLKKGIEKHLSKLEAFNSRVPHLRRNDICDCLEDLIDRLKEVLE